MTGKTSNTPRWVARGLVRGDFPNGEATVLVVDSLRDSWRQYAARIPQECNLLFVRDTLAAERTLQDNPAIGVVFVQGLSRWIADPTVDNLLEFGRYDELLQLTQRPNGITRESLNDYRNTRDFLQRLQKQGFGGLVQVVSNMLESCYQSELLKMEGLRVQYMGKQSFFSGGFTGKVDGLWEQIARFEQCRPLAHLVDWRLEQAVYPHPAEDRLFDRWERELSRWHSPYGKPAATAAEMSLTWLEELKLKINSGNPRKIYEHAAQLPDDGRTCDCLSRDGLRAADDWSRYLHPLHNDFNQAVWEILDMAGLMEWMGLELELDMACQNPDEPEFGRHVRRELGVELRGFFCPEGPLESWVGWQPKRRH